MSIPGDKGAKNFGEDPFDEKYIVRWNAGIERYSNQKSVPNWRDDWLVHCYSYACSQDDPHLINDTPWKWTSRPKNREELARFVPYSQMLPSQRWDFCDWLRRGRTFVPSSQYYPLLWLCSVERRIFEDGDNLDCLLDELVRLHLMCAEFAECKFTEFFERSTELLWFLLARFSKAPSSDAVFLFCEHVSQDKFQTDHGAFMLRCFRSRQFEREELILNSTGKLSYVPINGCVCKPASTNAPTLDQQREQLMVFWSRANSRWKEHEENRKSQPVIPILIPQVEVARVVKQRKHRSHRKERVTSGSSRPLQVSELGLKMLAASQQSNSKLSEVVKETHERLS